VQTPLSDDSAGFSEEDDSAAFSEELEDARLLEDSATISEEDDSASVPELELSATLADEDSAGLTDEELTEASELELARISEDFCEEDESPPTATGEPSVESPHATNVNGKANEPASIAVNNQLERDLLLKKNAILLSCPRILSLRSRMTGHLLFLNIYQKTRNIKLRVS
jgi:hypothetical protein